MAAKHHHDEQRCCVCEGQLGREKHFAVSTHTVELFRALLSAQQPQSKVDVDRPVCDQCHQNSTHLLSKLKKIFNVSERKARSVVSQFKFVDRIDFRYATKDLIETYLYTLGEPIVLTNTIDYIITKRFEGLNSDQQTVEADRINNLFTFDYLKRVLGDSVITVRNNETAEDFEWKMRDYVDYLNTKRDERENPLMYGKDLAYPTVWETFLFDNNSPLHELLKYKGSHDLLGEVPKELEAITDLVYIGDHDTFTPAHQDICGTMGHNLMIYSDCSGPSQIQQSVHNVLSATSTPAPPNIIRKEISPIAENEGYTLWCVYRRKHTAMAKEFWVQSGGSIDEDNTFLPFPTLLKSKIPAILIEQRAGDLVLIPPLSPHQVLNQHARSIKTAWATMTAKSLPYSYNVLPEYRKNKKHQVYRIKAVALYSLLKRIEIVENKLDIATDIVLEELLDILKVYNEIVQSEWIDELEYDPSIGNPVKFPDAVPHTRICNHCQADIFNRCFHCDTCSPDDDGFDCCLECYTERLGCIHRPQMKLTEHLTMNYCREILERGKQAFIKLHNTIHMASPVTVSELDQQLPRLDQPSAATLAHRSQKDARSGKPIKRKLKAVEPTTSNKRKRNS